MTMKFIGLLFLFASFSSHIPATMQLINDVSLNCGNGNHTIRINEEYARSFLLADDTFDGIALVNPDNRTMLSRCSFTLEDGYFVFRPNETTLMECPVVVTTAGMNLMEVFTVQLFRSTSNVLDRAKCYQWVFTCDTLREFNVTSGKIDTFSRSFVFEENMTNTYNYDISFFNDSTYDHVINAERVGYMDGSTVYMRVSVDATSNIVLLVNECHQTNNQSGIMVDLITSDRCNAAGTATYKAPDQQVDITYTASFDTPGDADLTNEFCEVTCLIELCDTLVEGANCDNTCVPNGRRRRSETEQKLLHEVTTKYRVQQDSCITFGCQQVCEYDDKDRPVCSCREGFALQDEDKRSCREIVAGNPENSDTDDQLPAVANDMENQSASLSSDQDPSATISSNQDSSELLLPNKDQAAPLSSQEQPAPIPSSQDQSVPLSPHQDILPVKISPPKHPQSIKTTTARSPTTSSSKTSPTLKTSSKPKTESHIENENHQNYNLKSQKEPPVSFEIMDEKIPQTESKPVREIKREDDTLQSAMFSAVIGLSAILVVLLAVIFYQRCRPKRKSLRIIDTMTPSSVKSEF